MNVIIKVRFIIWRRRLWGRWGCMRLESMCWWTDLYWLHSSKTRWHGDRL